MSVQVKTGENAPLIGEVGNANGEFSRRHGMRVGSVIRCRSG